MFQLYEKQLKIHGVSTAPPPAPVSPAVARALPRPGQGPGAKPVVSKTGASLLDNCYSKTLIDTHSMKTVDIKEVISFH